MLARYGLESPHCYWGALVRGKKGSRRLWQEEAIERATGGGLGGTRVECFSSFSRDKSSRRNNTTILDK